MPSEILIKVENVSKKFCRNLKRSLYYGLIDMTNELLGRNATGRSYLRKKEFWAVDKVSFELKRGECLGLIGQNGAGKSTLLKMLNGLIKPDTGRIEIRGRVGALIELGAGFNPILTGRENIYVNASVLGLTKKETDELFDQIVDFSELHEFIDTPVQYYSSGMKVRLGFSIASQLKPDVLLIDEILAVGDIGFKIKCYNEIFKLIEKAAVIFVSHSMPQVAKVCTRGILIKKGKINFESSNISAVIAKYYDSFDSEKTTIEGSHKVTLFDITIKNGDVAASFNTFTGDNENHIGEINPVKGLTIELTYLVAENILEYNILISVFDMDQKLVSQFIPNKKPILNNGKITTSIFEANNLILNTGKYSFTFEFLKEEKTDWGEKLLGIRSAISFIVKRDRFIGSSPVLHDGNWYFKSNE